MTVLEKLNDELIAKWDEYDLNRKAHLWKEFDTLGKDFYDKYPYKEREIMFYSDDDLHNQNVKSARRMVNDLQRRIESKVGNITDWYGLHCNPDNHGSIILNGRVRGENGVVDIRSITAGGVNIQKLHIRVLVRKL